MRMHLIVQMECLTAFPKPGSVMDMRNAQMEVMKIIQYAASINFFVTLPRQNSFSLYIHLPGTINLMENKSELFRELVLL